jgi:exopolysaccharide production protein ExoQ
MPPPVAAVLFVCGILGLFYLDRDKKVRSSWALWIPIVWLLLSGSRAASTWLGVAPDTSVEQLAEGSPIDRATYIVLLAAGIAVLLGRKKSVANLLQKNWPLVLFVLYCFISITWSEYPLVAFKRWIKSLGDYVMVLILLTEHDRSHAVRQVLARVGFLLLPVSVLFINYYPALGRYYARHWESTQFFVGVADNKNMLGMTCMVFGFAASWRVLEAWRGSRRARAKALLVHGTILLMAIWLLFKSDSKTSLICFVATSGLIAAHTLLKVARKRIVIHLMVATVILGSFSTLFLGVGGGLLESVGRNSTLTGRTQIWEVLLNVPINPVVGTGFESFWLGERLRKLWAMPELYNININEAHNGYIETYINLGAVGVIFILVLMATGYRNVLRLLDRDPEAGRLRLGYLVIAVIYNFTEAAIRTTDLVWIAFVLALMALPGRPAARTAKKKKRVTPTLVEAEQAV